MTAIVAPLMFLQPTKLLRGERKTYQCLPIWLALGGGVSFAWFGPLLEHVRLVHNLLPSRLTFFFPLKAISTWKTKGFVFSSQTCLSCYYKSVSVISYYMCKGSRLSGWENQEQCFRPFFLVRARGHTFSCRGNCDSSIKMDTCFQSVVTEYVYAEWGILFRRVKEKWQHKQWCAKLRHAQCDS